MMALGSQLGKFGDYAKSDTMLARAMRKLGSVFFMATGELRPSTPVIVNQSTTDGNWTLVASGLSNVLFWRLSERNGNDFRYAYVPAPTAYMTGFGYIKRQTDVSAIYVQRPTSSDIDMELEYWTI